MKNGAGNILTAHHGFFRMVLLQEIRGFSSFPSSTSTENAEQNWGLRPEAAFNGRWISVWPWKSGWWLSHPNWNMLKSVGIILPNMSQDMEKKLRFQTTNQIWYKVWFLDTADWESALWLENLPFFDGFSYSNTIFVEICRISFWLPDGMLCFCRPTCYTPPQQQTVASTSTSGSTVEHRRRVFISRSSVSNQFHYISYYIIVCPIISNNIGHSIPKYLHKYVT